MKSGTKLLSIILFLSFIILLVSCGKQKAEWKGTIEEKNGVTFVKNPKEPMYGEDVFSLEEDLTLGEKEGREEFTFSIINLDVDDEENIYVWDELASHIRVFDKGGKFLRTIGRKGQGPGEIQSTGHNIIQFTPQKEIMVCDEGARCFTFFSLDGKYLRQVSIARVGGLIAGAKIDSKGNFIVHTLTSPPGHALEKLDSKGEPIMTFFRKLDRQSLGGGIRVMKYFLFFSLTPDDNIVWGYNDKYELHVLNPEGKEIRRIVKNPKPVKITEEYRERIMNRYARLRSVGLDRKPIFPKHFPPFGGISVDEEGRIFVGTYEKTKNGKYFYDVFNRDGRYIARVPLELHPIVWKRSKMYAIYRDAEGYCYVKRYKVNLKF